MSLRHDLRSHMQRIVHGIMRVFSDAQHASWVDAIVEEANHLEEGRTRWLLGGLLSLACYRLSREIWSLLVFAFFPLAAIVFFTLLVRAQFVIWNSSNLLIGPVILTISIAPFAWQIGRIAQIHPVFSGTMAFMIFQSVPVILWPALFDAPGSLIWGINVKALGISPVFAPLLTLTLWFAGTLAGSYCRWRVTDHVS